MKKKKTKKLKATKRTVKRRKKESFSQSLSRFLILSLLLFAVFGLFTQKPINLHQPKNAPQLPKQLSLRIIITPTPSKTPTSASVLVAKAQAADANSDFCITVPILFYHHVEPIAEAQKLGHAQFTVDKDIFDRQMQYLKEQGYVTVSVDTIVHGIINRKSLAPKTIALTFDDGYTDIYTYAYPLLKKYGFVGNFAIPTGLLDKPEYMSWAQVTEIARDEAMEIYSHTASHTDLVNNPSLTELEITAAQNDIQNRLGLRSNIFFYPYGSFNQTIISTLRSKGYTAALSTLPGNLQCQSSLMYLHRTRIGNAPLSFYGL